MGYNIMDKQLPKRKNMRLPEYDYSNSGYYFITICTVNRKNIFSEIVGQGPVSSVTWFTTCPRTWFTTFCVDRHAKDKLCVR